MQKWHEKDRYDESKKEFVIFGANTIIQPPAVMVETVDTPIARTTMFGRIWNMSLTNLTLKIVSVSMKFLTKSNSKRVI